ncbi:MAG: solute carrier family 23 protein, partial [Gammaproteobacteria bacterium]
GWSLAWWLGCIPDKTFEIIASQPWFSPPNLLAHGVAFEWSMLPPFIVAALASTLKSVGDLTVCQRANDPAWQRIDMGSASRGATALGLTTLISGAIGTMGHSASSSNVGLSVASGATSRYIGYSLGVLLLLLAFAPKVSTAIALTPVPVIGATLMFAVATMVVAGVQIMATRLTNIRRTMVAGTAIGFSLSVALMPHLYVNVPPVLQPITASAVASAAILVILLHSILRIGTSHSIHFSVPLAGDTSHLVRARLLEFGESVGARRDVIAKATDTLNDALEALALGLAKGPEVHVDASFDEFSLDLVVRYAGHPFAVLDRAPTAEELLDGPLEVSRLACYLVRRRADRLAVDYDGTLSQVRIHFEH